MPGAGDFIQQMIGMVQLRNQMRQVAVKEQELELQRRRTNTQLFADFAKQAESLPTAADRTGLVDAFVAQGLDRTVLEQVANAIPAASGVLGRRATARGFAKAEGTATEKLLESFGVAREMGTTPLALATEPIQADMFTQGVEGMSPAIRARAGEYMATQKLTGLTPWGVEQQEALREGISPEMIQQGYLIETGLGLGARDVLQNDQFKARMEQEWAALRSNREVQELQLGLQRMGLEMDDRKLAATMAAGQGEDALKRLVELRQALEVMPSAGSEMERQAALALVNQHMSALTRLGLFAPVSRTTDPRTGREVILPRQFTEEDIARRNLGSYIFGTRSPMEQLGPVPLGRAPRPQQDWTGAYLGGQAALPQNFGLGTSRYAHPAPLQSRFLHPNTPPFIP